VLLAARKENGMMEMQFYYR